MKKLNWEKFACINFEWGFFTYRTEAGVTKIRSQCTQSSLRRPASGLHCNWTSKELRLRIVVDRKLRSCRQSFHWAVSTAEDIESLQMMGEWWKFIVLANLFLFVCATFFPISLFHDPIALHGKMIASSKLGFFYRLSHSPRHLGIGPDQWPLAKHSRFGGPLNR